MEIRLKIGKDTSTPYEEVDASSSRGQLLLADTKAPRKVVTVISSSVVDFIIVMNDNFIRFGRSNNRLKRLHEGLSGRSRF